MTVIRKQSKDVTIRYAYQEGAESQSATLTLVRLNVLIGVGERHAIKTYVCSVNHNTEKLVAYGRQCKSHQLFWLEL